MKLSLCVCYDSCHHLLELLVRKRAGRVGREEKKQENRTLRRLILWSRRLNDLQRKMEKSWPLSVHGVGDGSRRAALDARGSQTSFLEVPPSEQGESGQEKVGVPIPAKWTLNTVRSWASC